MKITIIETGLAPEPIRDDYASYPEMFEALISSADDGFAFETVSPVRGETLPDPSALQAILITGSAAGVYEDHDWMEPLFEFIRSAANERTPQVGICFGHQAIAKALGADVAKADAGWGLGLHTYDVHHAPHWMDPVETFALGVSHQDQVLSLPEGAKLIAASGFTPFAALDYPDAAVMSFQGHPEFDSEFFEALYRVREGTRFTTEFVNEAVETLRRPNHNRDVAKWISAFYRSKTAST